MIRVRGAAPFLALCAGLLAPAVPAASQASADTSLAREVLGEGIYLFRAPSALDLWTATNVVVVINDQDVTVFDSNTRPVTARMVIAEIRKLRPSRCGHSSTRTGTWTTGRGTTSTRERFPDSRSSPRPRRTTT
jgi:hypothetical protein